MKIRSDIVDLTVIKRDGIQVPFHKSKIENAIAKAGYVDENTRKYIATNIEHIAMRSKTPLTIEDIQDLVEKH